MKNSFVFSFSICLLIGVSRLLFAQADATTNSSGLPQPVFKNGEAQVVEAFNTPESWIKEELWVETDFDSDLDGRPDRMHVFVTRPAQTDSFPLRLPVIYCSSPYYGLKLLALLGVGTKKNFWNVKHELGATPKAHKHAKLRTREQRPFFAASLDRAWIPRGYIMVYSSSPGTGLSDGSPTVGGENESLAPKAVIDWLCGRAKAYTTRTGTAEVKAFWSSGKVGMTGTSYDGTLCIAAATTGVEGLKAIIPVAPVTSFYNYYRSNGLVRSPGGYMGEDMDVLYDLIHTGDKKKRKANNARVRDSVLVKNQDRITGDYNDFWASRDYVAKVDQMQAAMLMAHGFNDWNVMPEHSFRFYQAAKAKGLPVQLFYHQGGHGGDPPFSMMNRWFTRYLHEVENEVENDVPVRIVREYDKKPTQYAAYPDEEAADVRLFLQANGSQGGLLLPTPSENQPQLQLVDDYRKSGEKLLDEKNSKHRLLFVTPELQEDIRLSGISRITLRLSSSKAAANLSVWLVSLPWEDEKNTKIYDNIITRGWADPQNYKSLRKGEPLQPGQFYELSFELMPDDQIIRKGQQIGLMIFSSDKEFTLHPKPGTVLTLDLNGTRLDLPVVGGKSSLDKAIAPKN